MSKIAETFEKYMQLEDEAMHDYASKHNHFLRLIEDFDERMEQGESFGQVELARAQYFYSKARAFAYLIAGYYRGKQKYWEARAELDRAEEYEHIKLGNYNEKLKTVGDAENISRKSKGNALIQAAKNEKRYRQWEGIAETYESSINAIKDMKKGGRAEQEGQQFET